MFNGVSAGFAAGATVVVVVVSVNFVVRPIS